MPEQKTAHLGDPILAILFIFSRNLPDINRKEPFKEFTMEFGAVTTHVIKEYQTADYITTKLT